LYARVPTGAFRGQKAALEEGNVQMAATS